MAQRSKPLIMVVDDLESHLKAIGNTLMNADYDITLAFNGKRAIDIAKNALPDLILLDIMMPDITGFDVIKELKSHQATKDIPIIFLTSQKESEYILEGFALGAVDYIIKPANKEETIARVNTHLEIRNSRRIIQEQNQKLQGLLSEKNEFLELASKDLKTPLNEMRGYLDIIMTEDFEQLPKNVQEYIEKFDRTAKNMANVINDLLLINDIEAGNIKSIVQSVDINLAIKKVIRRIENVCRQKRISMDFNSNIPSNNFISADSEKLELIITRIYANALRFAKQSKSANAPWSLITTRAKLTMMHEKLFIYIEIEDQGVGLNKDDTEKFFDKFHKITINNSGELSVVESGMHIVKLLIESMGGKITVDSKTGVGTVVKFLLPAA